MSGVAGGDMRDVSLEEVIRDIRSDEAEPTWVFEQGSAGIGLVRNPNDPQGARSWQGTGRAGVIYGAPTNLGELGWDTEELFERLFERPSATATAVEGAFSIVAYDSATDRYLVVTDKLGAYPVYVTVEGPFRFASSVSPLVDRFSEPSVDRQAVSDMLLMGNLWGNRTLADEVKAVRPATVAEVTPDARTRQRYWKPDYTEGNAGRAYLAELVDRYRTAAKRTSRTIPSEAGIWLSGGLDSRTTAAALLEHADQDGLDSLIGFTYDANPPTNDNPEIATSVAERLGIDLVEVPLRPELFEPVLDRVIEATDGMVKWSTLVNLAATHNVDRLPGVMLEGMQGELVGDHPFRYHLDDSSSVVQAQHDSEAGSSVEKVRALLEPEVDPHGTFREEARRSAESTHRGKVLDIHFQNYYARNVLASDAVARDRVGTRAPQVDGDYLDWCASLPRAYRKGTFPFSERFIDADAGGVPYGTSRAKLELCRRIAPSLANVTYERTKTKPSRPYHLHAAGLVKNVVVNRIMGNPTYGEASLPDIWLRDRDTKLHERVVDLVDDARDRALFNGDVVQQAYADHMDGANNVSLLAKVTTLESWLQAHMD